MNALERLQATTRTASLLAACDAWPETIQVSRNSKTGVSLNVPIVGTCRPTTACLAYCYGETGPIALRDSVRLQARNLAALQAPNMDPVALADSIALQCAGHDFLRVNGVGDLTRESVRVLSALAVRHPRLTLWIATRKPELASLLPNAPNVQIMLSTDRTTRPVDLQAMRALVAARPDTAFLAYTQLDANDRAPEDVAIVFQLHRGSQRAKWSADSRSCAATVRDGAKHDNACADCRRCFDSERRA